MRISEIAGNAMIAQISITAVSRGSLMAWVLRKESPLS